MGLLEDFKTGNFKNYNLVLIMILFIFVFKIFWQDKKETMANEVDDEYLTNQILKAVREVYKTDLEAIRNLSNLSKKMIENDNITIPTNVFVNGQLNVGQKGVSNGVINLMNQQGGLGISLDSNDASGGVIKFYQENNTDSTGKNPGNFVSYNDSSLMTKGMILAWSGKDIPKGWALCDGSNNTPNLTDKFIFGSTLANIGKTGGRSDVTLTIENLPPHSHKLSKRLGDGGSGDPNIQRWNGTGGTELETLKTGSGASFSIMPPYYTLAYIMKL